LKNRVKNSCQQGSFFAKVGGGQKSKILSIFSLGFIRVESVYTTKLERISELGLNMNELYEMAVLK